MHHQTWQQQRKKTLLHTNKQTDRLNFPVYYEIESIPSPIEPHLRFTKGDPRIIFNLQSSDITVNIFIPQRDLPWDTSPPRVNVTRSLWGSLECNWCLFKRSIPLHEIYTWTTDWNYNRVILGSVAARDGIYNKYLRRKETAQQIISHDHLISDRIFSPAGPLSTPPPLNSRSRDCVLILDQGNGAGMCHWIV